jgi:hypothetical protein
MIQRVLLAFPVADKQTGCHIWKAFENEGKIVKVVDAKREPKTVFEVAKKFNPDLVFCSRTKELTKGIFQIREYFPKTVLTCWNVDSRKKIREWIHLFPLLRKCDCWFTVEKGHIENYKREKVGSPYWLPQGLGTDVYDRPAFVSDDDIGYYRCEIGFAGSLDPYHKARKKVIDQVIRHTAEKSIRLRMFGCNGRPRIYNQESCKFYYLSDINITYDIHPQTEMSISVRNFKIIGSGGFLLANKVCGVDEWLGAGRNFVEYDGIQDCLDKIDYYLINTSERKEIAERGYEFVHKHHTYQHRIKQALTILEKYHNERRKA